MSVGMHGKNCYWNNIEQLNSRGHEKDKFWKIQGLEQPTGSSTTNMSWYVPADKASNISSKPIKSEKKVAGKSGYICPL